MILSSAIACALIVALAAVVTAQSISVTATLRAGDLPIVHKGRVASLFYSDEDHKVVHIAAADLAADIGRVTGKRPPVTTTSPAVETAVIVGTIGKSPLIDGMANSGKLDVSAIRGKWESFMIRIVELPLANVGRALVIAGSDRRGTAFGVYEVSNLIGVSPWYWWADSVPDHRANLILTRGSITSREPSVKYRGIFINDEDWGLQPWAANTFEPETGDIGPKTYAKVFELLLRLKANTLWPAMHEVTRPFNSIPANRQIADDYAIVMGSSHAEPMLRNNVGEWKADKNAFNFVTNPDGVTQYWEQRVRENGKFENIYTIGMRGIHDSPILGTKSQAERISLLEKVFSAQRGLIAKHVDSDAESVPQIFCPYKEVLTDYRAGLKVPEDVTIVFPDDNFGYIRQFPTVEERKRKGGFGVYYHISYLGRPFSYLWLNSTPPALIWQEMNKAYTNGMRNLWIVNVGDIKPGEIGMEFFLQMAYEADRWTIENQHDYLRTIASREFGDRDAEEIADILDRYYRLGFQRRPEHLQWYLPNEPTRPSPLTISEKLDRLGEYANLRKRAETLCSKLAVYKKDAFYQLVLYPIKSAALANERFFAAEIAREFGAKWPSIGRDWALRSIAADREITKETKHFNETLTGGKWRNIMSMEMNAGQWPSMRTTPPNISPYDFATTGKGAESFRPLAANEARYGTRESTSLFSEWKGVVSVEAESFQRSNPTAGFAWRVIRGLGKTGDSVSVFPAYARTFDTNAVTPSLEYEIDIQNTDEFDLYFFLIPTQPLVKSNALRIAFSIDGQKTEIVEAGKGIEVSSREWSKNILDATVVGRARISVTKGRHILRISAVDTGVVLDKIVLARSELPSSYLGPAETRFENIRRNQ